jgi:hypothetical protein
MGCTSRLDGIVYPQVNKYEDEENVVEVDVVSAWLSKYDWFNELPVLWRQITHRLVKELTAETFVGLSTLHQALSARDPDAVWDALSGIDLSDKCIDMLDQLMRLAVRSQSTSLRAESYEESEVERMETSNE